MTYTGAMVLPQNAVVLQKEEMRYLEGGKKVTRTQKASSLIKYTGKMMAAWASLAGGYTYSAAAAAASGIGVGVSAICGLGAGYCALVANEYRAAYNKLHNYKSSTKCKLTEVLLCGVATTGVSVKKA